MVDDAMRRSVRWPKAPNGLSSALRMAATLRAAGIELQFGRNNEQGKTDGVRAALCCTGPKRSSVIVSDRQQPGQKKALRARATDVH